MAASLAILEADRAPRSEREHQRGRWRLAILAALGLLAAALAAFLASAPNKVLVPGLIACALLPVVLWLRGERFVPALMVSVLALSVPINLRVNLFVQAHTGGAPSITVTPTLLALILFYVLWFYRRSIGALPQVMRFHPAISVATVLLLTFTLPSLLNASYPSLVMLEWIRLACLALALVAMMSLQDVRLVRTFIFALSIQVFIQVLLAGLQYGLKRTLGLHLFGEEALLEQNIGFVAYRATGTLGHPNALAYFLELLLPIMLGLALTRQPARWKLWYALAFAAGMVGMFTTLTRGGWLALPLPLLLVAVVVYGRRVVRIKAAATLVVAGAAALVALWAAYPTLEKRLTHSDYRSSAVRMPLNMAAWSIVEKHPLVGVGLNNFAEVFKRDDETGNSRIFRGYRHLVHNMYLWIWVEVGLLGLIGYLAPFVVTIVVALRAAPRAPPVPRAILAGVAGGLLAQLQHGLVDPGFRVSLATSFLIFLLMGIAGSLALHYPPRGRNRARVAAP